MSYSERRLPALCLSGNTGRREKYQFYEPETKERGGLKYTLLEEEGAIRIEDAGVYEEAVLSLCTCKCQGDAGNIRAGNGFSLSPARGKARLYNPLREAAAERKRKRKRWAAGFAADIRREYRAGDAGGL